jgi:hypothetical protein
MRRTLVKIAKNTIAQHSRRFGLDTVLRAYRRSTPRKKGARKFILPVNPC